MEQLEKLATSGDFSLGGLQHKQRLINVLNKQIEQKNEALNEKQTEIDKLKENMESINQNLNKV
jgi:flagellar biosynthesis chaperone FliJ